MILPRSSERSPGSFSGTAANVVAVGRGDLGTRTRVRFVALVLVSLKSQIFSGVFGRSSSVVQ